MAEQPDTSQIARMTNAFGKLAGTPKLPLLQRYEARMTTSHQRALHNLILLK